MCIYISAVGLWVIYYGWIDPVPSSYYMFVVTEGIVCFHMTCQRWRISLPFAIYEVIAYSAVL
jgi:hypothetical protein